MSRFIPWRRRKRKPEEPSDSPSATNRVRREAIGLTELTSNGEEKSVDVVAVHGLQGDPFTTWESKDGGTWLEDILPGKVPFARIMTFGYDSTVAFTNSVAKIEHHALALLNDLSSNRKEVQGTASRPIVFLGHSLGGIVIKKALILAHDRRSSLQDFEDILQNTKAIAFLAVPHRGSGFAQWVTIAANVLRAGTAGVSTNTAVLAELGNDSTTLTDISNQFIDRAKDLKIYTFYELEKISGVLVRNEAISHDCSDR